MSDGQTEQDRLVLKWRTHASQPSSAIAAALGLLERIALALEELVWGETQA